MRLLAGFHAGTLAATVSGACALACGTNASMLPDAGADAAATCLTFPCSSSDAGSGNEAATGDASADENGSCPLTTCSDTGTPIDGADGATAYSDAELDVRTPADAADAGVADAAPAGLIRCGSSWCDAHTQDCCFHPDWSEYCGPKGSGCGLSCSSPASCPAGQTCCATQAQSGTVVATCSSTPCAASGPAGSYQLCATKADCPGGQPCTYHVIPASDPGPIACDRCAAVSCATPMQCCPSSGNCYNPGCGSCCN